MRFLNNYHLFLMQRFKYTFIFMVLNVNSISVTSWWSVLLVEETGGPGENHRPIACH